MKKYSKETLEIVSSSSLAIVLMAIMAGVLCSEPASSKTSGMIQEKTVRTIHQKPEKKPDKIISHVHMTVYQPVKEQCNSRPLITADGSRINLDKLKRGQIKWCAVSRDLEYLFPLGSRIHIYDEKTGKDYGIYVIKDRMNKRWTKRIDILIHPDSKLRLSESNIRITKI